MWSYQNIRLGDSWSSNSIRNEEEEGIVRIKLIVWWSRENGLMETHIDYTHRLPTHIDYPHRVYKSQELRVNSCHKKCYSAKAGSVIKESDTETTIRRKVQATESVETLMFSSESVNEFKRSNFCKNCERNAVPLGMFVTCNDCAS